MLAINKTIDRKNLFKSIIRFNYMIIVFIICFILSSVIKNILQKNIVVENSKTIIALDKVERPRLQVDRVGEELVYNTADSGTILEDGGYIFHRGRSESVDFRVVGGLVEVEEDGDIVLTKSPYILIKNIKQ